MLRAVNPATGRVVREVAFDTDETVEAKVQRAAVAFWSWRELSFEERGEHLRAVARELRAGQDELAGCITAEMGKVITESRGEIAKCAATAEHFAEHAARYLASERIESDASESRVQYLPLGTVLGILPWNSPFWLAFRVCAPALMAGNTVLLKNDQHVPGCALALEEVFGAASVPPGVVQSLLVTRESVAGVLRDPRVAAVSFTGSTGGGSAVAQIAATVVKPSVLELGGSDPAVVLADADLDEAAEKIGLMRVLAAGQSCIAAKRVIVEDPVYDAFLERFTARLKRVRVGDPTDSESEMGPVARESVREELHRQVTESVEQGARLVLGGVIPDGPGAFYPVTLLADTTPAMTCAREETFGPVAAVMRARDVDHAVELANDTPFGLAASLWTTRERGEALAARLETGQVAVNGVVKSDARLPSGGIKLSGWGKELGPQGIREFTNSQQVWIR